jgi:hypothetical protein
MQYGTSGYASGDDLGAGGYNPHFDPDPENSGASGGAGPVSGDGEGISALAGARSFDQPDDIPGSAASIGDPHGPDPDNEWGAGGYNPHYQPWGSYVWSPYSRSGAVGTTRAAPVLPARVQRAAAVRFK